MDSLLSKDNEWTFDLIEDLDREIGAIAEEFGLDTYPNQIEIIRSDQMMDAYASIGMPVGYHHWSFGKHLVSTQQNYQRGYMGLAYEIVINSSPCIAYLMEENTLTMQALVIAHACYGHNSFFKGNYLFRTWTDATAIIDYLVFAKDYVSKCEEKYGVKEVEKILDSCHALMNYGVDRYKRPVAISAEAEKERQKEREQYIQMNLNDLWRTIPGKEPKKDVGDTFPKEPEENLLYFIEKNAPLLENWQREIVRIVRKIAQYFYPQRQTQVMNEGWASFWHYTLLHELYERGKVDEGFIVEFLTSHTAVLYQPGYDHPGYNGINPYALGFAIFSDLKRMCLDPTEEDEQWFPDIAGNPDWFSVISAAMRDFKDESFILQFLSPKVMRDLKLFGIVDDDHEEDIYVAAIHDDVGYKRVRDMLARQYNIGDREPNIQVKRVALKGDRSLTLHHQRHERRPMGQSTEKVLKHVHRLWGFPVHLESYEGDTQIERKTIPEEKK